MKGRHLAVLGAVCCMSGCVVTNDAAGPVQYENQSVERDGTQLVHVNLHMGAGDLKVGSGTQKLLQAYFTYNVPFEKPEVRYSGGDLSVEQPSSHGHFSSKYEWDLRLNQSIPLDMHVRFGAGKAQLDLGGLTLRNVDIEMGVGELQLDLRGMPKEDYRVHIRGGIGHATVRLPANVGIDARASGGIGDIQARGLHKRDGHWVNDASNGTGVKVRLNIEGGIGEIQLIADSN